MCVECLIGHQAVPFFTVWPPLMHRAAGAEGGDVSLMGCLLPNVLVQTSESAKVHKTTGVFISLSDLFPQLGAPSSLTHSSELGSPGQSELNNIDLAALFSDAPGDGGSVAGASDEALSSGILTIDVTSVSASLGGNLPANNSSLGPMDPLVLVAHSDIPPSLDSPLVLGTAATVLQQSSFGMDDVPTVSAGALGCLVALPVKNLSPDPQALTSGVHLADTTTTLTSPSPAPGNTGGPELLAPIKVEPDSPPGPNAARQQERSRGAPRSVFCSPAERHSPQKDTGLGAGTGNFYLV